MRNRRLLTAILLEICSIIILLFALMAYIVFIAENKIVLALFFLFSFALIFCLIIKIVVSNSESGDTNRIFYENVYMKIDSNSTLKNKQQIHKNIQFLNKLQFAYLFSFKNKKNLNLKGDYAYQKSFLEQVEKEKRFNEFYNRYKDIPIMAVYKKIKKQYKFLKKKDLNCMLFQFDEQLYQNKMNLALRNQLVPKENRFGDTIDYLLIIVAYVFPFLNFASEKEIGLVLSIAVILGILMVIWIIVLKYSYQKILADQRKVFNELLVFFNHYKIKD